MEVGSELLLHPDGRFEYMLAYGALDELASGCWTRSGATVTLHAYKFEHSMEDPMKFERLDLTVQPGGKLMRRFDAEHNGAYSRQRTARHSCKRMLRGPIEAAMRGGARQNAPAGPTVPR
jgi:hypothetical protein